VDALDATVTNLTLESAVAAGVPSVRIEPGRGREWATHVSIAEWEGPLGLLLSLIEARRLDVLTVPLGGLAEAYLEALARIEHDRMGSISAFVAVASQLILIKSRAMLPRPPALPDVTFED
jgi:chromatin segregation and condensation protein Rec8/ScpA/Scc1 (kleisin family)